MKRYIKHTLLLAVAWLSMLPNAVAQVDLQSSFMVMRTDDQIEGILEGGEWIIRFSDTDTMGNLYSYPVAMSIQSVASPDTCYVPLEKVDSVLFQLPQNEMEPDVFELTESHLKYIISTDSVSTVDFRIDCVSKVDLPRVGQKVICNILRDPLPFGLVGRVKSFNVSYDDGWVRMVCEPLTISDIYTRYYGVSVSDLGGNSTQGPSKTRRLAPSNLGLDMSPMADEDDEKDNISFNEYFILKKDGDPTFTNTPSQLAGDHLMEIGVNLNGKVKVHHIAAIDNTTGKEYKDIFVTIDVLAEFPCKFHITKFDPVKNDWEKRGFKAENEIELPTPPIPTPIPGLSVMPEMGFQYGADVQLFLEISPQIPIRKKVGVRINGVIPSGIWEDLPGGQKPEKELAQHISLLIKGNAFIGPYIKVSLSLAQVLAMGIKVQPKLSLEGSLQFNPGHMIGYLDEITPDNISMMKTNYDNFTKNNRFEAKIGVALDGLARLQLWKSGMQFSLVEFLKDIGALKGDPFMFPAFSISALSPFEVVDNSFMSIGEDDYYSATFETAFNDLSVFTSYAKGGLFLLDKENKLLVKSEIASNDDIYDTNNTFSFGQKYRGETVGVYPYLHLDYTGYMTPGQIEKIYIPFHPELSIEGEKTFDKVVVKATYPDEEVVNNHNKYYNRVGVQIRALDDSKSVRLPFNMIGSTFTETIERSVFAEHMGETATKAYVSAYIYDKDDDKYSYSDEIIMEYEDYSKPQTLEATNITCTTARLNARLHESTVLKILGDDKNRFGFLYHIPGESGTTKEVEYKGSDWPSGLPDDTYYLDVTGLRAGTRYEYYAYTRINGMRYDGEKFFLITESPMSNLRYESGTNFAIVYADIAAEYIDESIRKDLYFEIVEFGKDFADAIGKRVGETDWTYNDDGSATVDVMFTDLLPDQLYQYRLVMIDVNNNKIISEVNLLITDKVSLTATTKGATVNGNTVKITGSLSPDLVDLLKSQGVEHVYFDYSKNEDFSSAHIVKLSLNSFDYSTTLSNLSYGTIYYYQFYAIDLDETRYEGDVLTFVTDDAPVENVEECYTLPATVEDADVIMTGGVPSATLTAIEKGVYKNMQYGFEIAESQSDLTGKKPTFATDKIDMDTGMFTIKKVLQPNTVYYIRAMVFFNDKWVVAPEIVTVKTAVFDPGLIPPDVK